MYAQTDMACEGGATARNGYRERGLASLFGDIVQRIPKLRAETYFPEGLIERCSRADRAVAESRASGVSTRKMERIARKIGIERLSKDQFSATCRTLDAGVAELVSRDLEEVGFPSLFLDATHVNCRRDGRVQSTAIVTAIVVGPDEERHMPCIATIDTDIHTGCLGFLRTLCERRFSGMHLVVSDDHAGLVRAIAERLPGVGSQRCVIHFELDACSLLPSRRRRAMAGKALQAVFRETDPAIVRSAYRAAIDAVGAMSACASALLEEAEADVLTYLDFSAEHRRRIRTNNVQER